MLTWAVVGSRDYPRLDLVRSWVETLAGYTGPNPPRRLLDVIVISGGARGVDLEATNHARAIGLQAIDLPADWTKGPTAGFERNVAIVRAADQLTAFWDGLSSGTVHSIVLAWQKGIPVGARWGTGWVDIDSDVSLPPRIREAYQALQKRWGDQLPEYSKHEGEEP